MYMEMSLSHSTIATNSSIEYVFFLFDWFECLSIQLFEHLVSGQFVLNRRSEIEGYLYALMAFHLEWDLSGNPPSYILAMFANICKVTRSKCQSGTLWMNHDEIEQIGHRKLQCALSQCGGFWSEIGVDLSSTHRVQSFEWDLDHQELHVLHALKPRQSLDSDLFEYRLPGRKVLRFWLRAHCVHFGDENRVALSVHLDVDTMPHDIDSVHCECVLFCEYGKRHRVQRVLHSLRFSPKGSCSDLQTFPAVKLKRRHSMRWRVGMCVLSVRSMTISPPPPSVVTSSSLPVVDGQDGCPLTAADIVTAVEQRETSKLVDIFTKLVQRTKQKEQEVEAMRSSMKHYIQQSEDLQEELAQNRMFLEQLHRASVHRDMEEDDVHTELKEMEYAKGASNREDQHHLHVPMDSDTPSDGFDHGFNVSGPSMSILNSRSNEIKDDDAGARLQSPETMKLIDGHVHSAEEEEEDVVGVIYDAMSGTEEDCDDDESQRERDHVKALEEDLGDIYGSFPYRTQPSVHPPAPKEDIDTKGTRGTGGTTALSGNGNSLIAGDQSPATVTYRQWTPTEEPAEADICRYRIGTGLVEIENVSRTMASTNSTELKLPEPNHYVLKTPESAMNVRHRALSAEPEMSSLHFEGPTPLGAVKRDGGDREFERRSSLLSRRRYLSADVYSSPDTVTPTVYFGDGGVAQTFDGLLHSGDLVSTTKSVSDDGSRHSMTDDPDGDEEEEEEEEMDTENGNDDMESGVDSSTDQTAKHPVIRSRVLYDAGRWALNRSSNEKSDSQFGSVNRNVLGKRQETTVSISTLDDMGLHLARHKRRSTRNGWRRNGKKFGRRISPRQRALSAAGPLPSGWTTACTPTGLIMYLNHQMEIAQFEPPTMEAARGNVVVVEKRKENMNKPFDTRRKTDRSPVERRRRMQRGNVRGNRNRNRNRIGIGIGIRGYK